METDTPRTDAEAIPPEQCGAWDEYVPAVLSRQLERENARLKGDLQNAWVKCHSVMMALLDTGETWEPLIGWVEDRRDELDPQRVGDLSTISSQAGRTR